MSKSEKMADGFVKVDLDADNGADKAVNDGATSMTTHELVGVYEVLDALRGAILAGGPQHRVAHAR
jgi:hypothetical protein